MNSLLKALTGLIVSICILFASSVLAEDKPAVIVLFGDSITVGENESSYRQECPKARGLRPGRGSGQTDFCTPDKELSTILNESARASIVVNRGIGGSNTSSGVSRLGAELDVAKAQHDGSAYYVLILYGTNDFGFGFSTSTTRNNIRAMINIAESKGFIPIVSNLLPRNDRNVSGSENGAIASAASLENARFVDQFSNYNSNGGFSLHDNEAPLLPASLRLHPRKAGYIVVAQHWFDAALSSLIEPVEPVIPVAPVIMLLLDDEPTPP